MIEIQSSLTFEEIEAAHHRLKVQRNFNAKYEKKGGVEKLLAMAKPGNQREVAEHFGLVPQRISTIYRSLTGCPWPADPPKPEEDKDVAAQPPSTH